VITPTTGRSPKGVHHREPGRTLIIVLGARRVGAYLLLAAAFGVAAGLLKGNDPGLRGGFGNLSAPWVLVGLLPAVRCSSMRRGALMGLAATMAALLGFYATLTVVLAGHLGGGGYVHELLVEVRANRVYFLGGVVTGLLAGAAGAWLGRRHRREVPLLAGLLLAGEALVVGLVQGRRLLPAPVYFAWGVDDWTPYLVETAVGLLVVAVAWWRLRSRVAPDA